MLKANDKIEWECLNMSKLIIVKISSLSKIFVFSIWRYLIMYLYNNLNGCRFHISFHNSYSCLIRKLPKNKRANITPAKKFGGLGIYKIYN